MMKLIELIERETDRAVSPGTRISDMGLDSLDLVDLYLEIGSAFDCEIKAQDAQGFDTVGDIGLWLMIQRRLVNA